MKKKSQIFRRILTLMTALILVLNVLVGVPSVAEAASTTKKQKSYEIAVVFDNSGSMYGRNEKAWSRAKYAMEIFASMLNYKNNDKLRIFPMWEVTTTKEINPSQGSYQSFEVACQEDIEKIKYLYTVSPGRTPLAPVTEAYEYLNASSADEKWLIVLTDGEFNDRARGVRDDNIDLQKELLAYATNNIKVQYLGFGAARELKSNQGAGFYAKKSTDTSLKQDLIDICNMIFQREELKGRLKGKELNLDLSMKNLIVFAQGTNAQITSLTDSEGNEIPITLNSGKRTSAAYKNYVAGDTDSYGFEYVKSAVDDSLAGQVVNFDACHHGTYTLNYSGADSVQIFYEPDVDIEVVAVAVDEDGKEGEVVDFTSGEFEAGEYKITSRIVDSFTGKDVTNHELMGNVKLSTYVKTSADSEYVRYENGAGIKFGPDASTEIFVEGEYLKDYKISTKDDSSTFPIQFNVIPPRVDFTINASVLQDQNWYKLSDNAEWKPVRVSVTLDGQPATDEQLANINLAVESSETLTYTCKAVNGESAFDIYIGKDANGNYVEPETGKYTLNFSGTTFTDEHGEVNGISEKSNEKVSFEIQNYSKIWKWLFWIVLILIILIIILAILNHPSMPSEIYLYLPKKHMANSVRVTGTSVALSTDLYPGEVKCIAKACSPFKIKGSTSAKFEVTDIKPLPSVEWYEIDGVRFKKSTTKYVDDEGKTIAEYKPKVKVGDGAELRWKTSRHSVTGTIYINHNDNI